MSDKPIISRAKRKTGTDYKLGQDNVEIFGLDVHNPVFAIAAATIVVFVVFTLVFNETAAAAFGALRPWITSTFDWLFALSVDLYVVFCIALAVSPLGKVRIGGRKAKPEYRYLSWFAMMFAAGLGIGLMFYGVLEPVYHFVNPPLGIEPADAAQAAGLGMAATLFHWTLHPWAVYAVVGLAIAVFCYNKGLPLTIRSAFYPLLGERIWGWPGHVIDILAVFATLFGIATTLGYGAEQASAGIEHLYGIEATSAVKVGLILVITAVALFSVLRGLDGGVKLLSEINLVMAGLFCLFVIVTGSTLAILTGFFGNLVDYLRYLPSLSNWVGREDLDFFHGWTTFYWAWWIAWSPFVGMFIARISRGRTVREFIVCALLVPSLACVLWMTTFGGTAVEQYVTTGYTAVVDAVTANQVEMSLFRFLENLPFSSFFSFLTILLIVIFFVTSMDSGSLVIDTITAGGKLDAPVMQRVFWCTFEGLVAIALLLGGGLASLQALALATAFPFTILLLVMCVAIVRGLHSEHTGYVPAATTDQSV